MIDERTEELASLYALDLLEGAELAAFETELARNAGLRALVAGLREAASTLALASTAAAPSPALKTRLLAEIAARRTDGARHEKATAVPFVRWVPWAMAACFALAAAWMARLYLVQRAQSITLREEAEFAHIESQSVKNQLQAERLLTDRQVADLQQMLKANDDLAQLKIATLVSLAGNSPEARAIAVWDPARQEGLVSIEKLPAAAAGRDYELWVIDPEKRQPVSAGVFVVGADGDARVEFTPEEPVAMAAKFAVSLEKKGGAPKNSGPQGRVIMISE